MSKKPKLTPWFPATVKPARKGVYEVPDVFWAERAGYAYWNGKRFCFRADDPEMAFTHRGSMTCFPGRVRWRGLAKNPAPGAAPSADQQL